MYLSRIEINNFRGISSLSLNIHKGVNILIGENNTGKTTVLDALRICFELGAERKEIFVQPEDFYVKNVGSIETKIEFHLTFSEPSVREQGVFIELLSFTKDKIPELQLHLTFTWDGIKSRRKHWGGDKEGQDIPYEVIELFYFTHLSALRDATRDLAPSRGNRLSRLFLKLIETEEKRQLFADNINKKIKEASDWQDLLKNGKDTIQKHLKKVSLQEDETEIEIDFVETTFKRIVENLRMFIPQNSSTEGDGEPATNLVIFEISQNGLGYNNLIYIATVLGDLLERRRREPDSYISLLIEEPESHLHPQWQSVLFSYLKEIESHGIQVFITSHSPSITAKSNIDQLIVMTKNEKLIKSTPIRAINLGDNNKKYLERFLDVTKSQLFFAKSVILVEGISEALLVPCFAKLIGQEFDLEKNAVEVVNIGGVSFESFALLFNNSDTEKRINVWCSIITDDDRSEDAEISSRAEKALDLSGGLLDVFLAKNTFEYELFIANEDLITSVYKDMHPKTDLSFAGEIHDKALAFVDKIKSNNDKAIFAQNLAQRIEPDENDFVVPDYIIKAIKWAVKGDESNTDGETESSHT